MNFDSYYQPPDPPIFRCTECDEMNEDCECEDGPTEDDGCNSCGEPRGCRCDYDYDSWKESQWED